MRSQDGGFDIRFGGEALGRLIATRQRGLVDRVLVGLAAELAAYRELPAEALAADIADTVQRAIRLFLTTLATGTMPTEDELEALGDSIALRAEEEVPLGAVLAAYQVGARLVLEEMGGLAGPGDAKNVLAATTITMQFLTVVDQVIAARYLRERQIIDRVAADRLADDLRQLLEGNFKPEEAADIYIVAQLAVPPHPDENSRGIGSSVASHRKLRRLRAQLSTEPETMSQIGSDGGLLIRRVRIGSTEDAWSALSGVVDRLSKAAGIDVHAAGTLAHGAPEIPSAVAVAKELLELVITLGEPAGLHRLEDHAVHYQLTRPGPARDVLARVLDPLNDLPELRETLDSYLRFGRDRRLAAAALHIHPNTVDYRLRRISKLLSIDPTDRTQTVRLVAALAARPGSSSNTRVET